MIFLYLRIYALKELLLLYNLNVQSLPSRERGLKHELYHLVSDIHRRSPRGSVD